MSRSAHSGKKTTPKVAALPPNKFASRNKTPEDMSKNLTPVNRSTIGLGIQSKQASSDGFARPHSYNGKT